MRAYTKRIHLSRLIINKSPNCLVRSSKIVNDFDDLYHRHRLSAMDRWLTDWQTHLAYDTWIYMLCFRVINQSYYVVSVNRTDHQRLVEKKRRFYVPFYLCCWWYFFSIYSVLSISQHKTYFEPLKSWVAKTLLNLTFGLEKKNCIVYVIMCGLNVGGI